MVSRESAPEVGRVCWLDLGVIDVDAAASFYGRIFGWTVAAPDDAGYRLASRNGRLVAALGPAEDPGPPYWTIYLHTVDIAASMAAVSAAGGAIVAPPSPAGDAGVAAIARDPHVGPVSFWQPGTHLGTDLSGGHGTLAGVELRPHDPEGAAAFVRAVAGWLFEPDGAIRLRGRVVATWARRPVTVPSIDPTPWLVRFQVDDLAAVVAEARALGARSVPGEAAVLIDPAGACFGLAPALRPATGET